MGVGGSFDVLAGNVKTSSSYLAENTFRMAIQIVSAA